LKPSVIAAGHGRPIQGRTSAAALERFAAAFPVPPHGRYVAEAAETGENGVVQLPPAPFDPLPPIAAAVAAGAVLGHFAAGARRR
jgi:hypothetical protein